MKIKLNNIIPSILQDGNLLKIYLINVRNLRNFVIQFDRVLENRSFDKTVQEPFVTGILDSTIRSYTPSETFNRIYPAKKFISIPMLEQFSACKCWTVDLNNQKSDETKLSILPFELQNDGLWDFNALKRDTEDYITNTFTLNNRLYFEYQINNRKLKNRNLRININGIRIDQVDLNMSRGIKEYSLSAAPQRDMIITSRIGDVYNNKILKNRPAQIHNALIVNFKSEMNNNIINIVRATQQISKVLIYKKYVQPLSNWRMVEDIIFKTPEIVTKTITYKESIPLSYRIEGYDNRNNLVERIVSPIITAAATQVRSFEIRPEPNQTAFVETTKIVVLRTSRSNEKNTIINDEDLNIRTVQPIIINERQVELEVIEPGVQRDLNVSIEVKKRIEPLAVDEPIETRIGLERQTDLSPASIQPEIIKVLIENPSNSLTEVLIKDMNNQIISDKIFLEKGETKEIEVRKKSDTSIVGRDLIIDKTTVTGIKTTQIVRVKNR